LCTFQRIQCTVHEYAEIYCCKSGTPILQRLAVDGRRHMAQELNVTEDTIRRDLRDLAAAGLCQKVYGGAVRCRRAEGGTLTQRMALQQSDNRAWRLPPPRWCGRAPPFSDAGSSNLAIAARCRRCR
jgi:DNA-binding transcriptional MocR family regulator